MASPVLFRTCREKNILSTRKLQRFTAAGNGCKHITLSVHIITNPGIWTTFIISDVQYIKNIDTSTRDSRSI